MVMRAGGVDEQLRAHTCRGQNSVASTYTASIQPPVTLATRASKVLFCPLWELHLCAQTHTQTHN